MSSLVISMPQSTEEAGVSRSLLENLALKTLYLEGELLVNELAERMHLSAPVVEELFQRLRKDQLCEVRGATGGVYRIRTTSQGKDRALELLSLNQYAGPAPVSLQDYVSRVRAQSVRNADVFPPDVQRAFSHLVLGQETLAQIGAAVASGTSLFLFGPTGTGKTSIAEALPAIYSDYAWLPYAVEIDGQIITVYDSIVHEAMDTSGLEEFDRRWVLCRRPRILAGGELTIEMLDLQYSPISKFYAGPLQMKANNGVLIIDDFGRQRVRPEEMLNRWIVPLDRGIDFLTLAGGKKFEVPFDLLVVFSTNLNPTSLADEAFMRRIPNKIRVDCIEPSQFHEIFRLVCQQFKVAYDAEVVDQVVETIRSDFREPLRACYPRDIVRQICWTARYEGKQPQLNRDTVARACRNYFLPP
jgi:predicted ATPase with chaperone activity